MQSKKSQTNERKNIKTSKSKQLIEDDDDFIDDTDNPKPPVDENELEVRLADEMLGESDVEDDEEFIQEIEKFKKEHSNSKIVSVHKKLGKPKIAEFSKLAPDAVKAELRKLIQLLDEHKIIVHFQNDYSDKEKYRFITAEIFNEVVDITSKQPVKFIYEDYHPEMDDDDDEEDY